MHSNSKETNVYWGEVVTPFFQNRKFYLAATEKGLCRVLWPSESLDDLQAWVNKMIPDANLEEGQHKVAEYVQQIKDYLHGKRKTFSLPLDMRGTAFRIKVWNALQQIPHGETRSYADIADAIGNSKALRAVGTANGANPIPIVVPCHRVIGKNKTLTGFGGGLENKKRLLNLEGYDDYIDKGHLRYQF
ncbi:methylated-DNA--[protein]-cysteine S-methyltransferase [Shimazuella sp. AN120528]|uniref:methylated-DNA--[protein]-cysteine S-methyltransferase n=1 Tax=Shimazuella soli TaxID=1892854 RepID=UPI001F10EBAE|nr:methylated-DNA--[protein]-cysteine S-methyltransferase [Shimazuella soli]MCH5585547.1 methylated-DNA--[protein]-cysteine S-methyltransferase [Shimazuella soli]